MRLLIATALGAALFDQISKYLVIHLMDLVRVGSVNVWSPFLTFRYGENRGINFGLLNGNADWMPLVLIGFSLAVVGAVFFWIWRWHADSAGMQVGAGLLIGGALGNVSDRLVFGYVQDFLNMSCCGLNNPYVFNIADVFIFAGAGVLVIFDSKRNKKKAA